MKSKAVNLAALLILALFITACGRNTDPPQITHDENAPPPPPRQYYTDGGQPAGQDVIRGIHTPVDFNGRVITIGRTVNDRSIPLMMLPSVHMEPDPALSANYARDRMIWNNARRVEREFNIIIEEVELNGPNQLGHQLRTSVAAGNAFADIVLLPPDMILEAAVNNLIQPLDTINLPNSDLLGLQIYSRFTAEGLGHAWAFSTTVPSTAAFTLGVNLDVIRAAGAPNPVDLFNSGYWTWDAMLEIMRATTLNTTGDGTIDQWGIAEFVSFSGEGRFSRIDQCNLLRGFIGANDGMLTTDDLNYGLDHPNSIEAMAFMETILQEGLLRPNRIESPAGISLISPSITDGNFAFITGREWGPPRWYAHASDLPFEFAVVPLPTGPSNTSGNTWLGGWEAGLALPWGSAWEAAELLMIMEEYFAWAGYDWERISDVPIIWVNSVILSDEDAARQIDALSTKRLDLGVHVPRFASELNNIINNFIPLPHPDMTWWYTRTAQEVAEDFREPMQAELDSFFR